jgi:hypothetical protein
LLEQLLLAPCVSLVSCRDRDWLERERVCVHVYRPSQFLPKPLLETPLPPPRQRRPVSFKLAYPELVLCSLPRSLVETFQYFWPLSKEEFRDFESGARIEWALPTIDGPDGMVRLREALRAYRDYLGPRWSPKPWSSRRAWRSSMSSRASVKVPCFRLRTWPA